MREYYIVLGVIAACTQVQGLNIQLTQNSPTAAHGLNGPHWGRVEIEDPANPGTWGTIESTGWDDEDAIVVCRQLGFTTGFSTRARYGYQYSDSFLSNVQCSGSETTLDMCANTDISNYGSGAEYAAVACYDDSGPQVRLTPGPDYGLVEVSLNGVWGTVCHHSGGYERRRATVICKQLGYAKGNTYYVTKPKQIKGTDDQPLWLHDVRCTGNENSIFDCPVIHGWGTGWYHCHDRHNSDMNIRCHHDENSLIPESSFNHGRLNAYIKSIKAYRQICDVGWDDNDAKVACKSLGYTNGKAYSLGTFHAYWWGASYALSQFECTGYETNLWDCAHVSSGSGCPHTENTGMSTAGVLCYDESQSFTTEITLSHRTDNLWGRVQISNRGVYGQICDSDWTQQDAEATCKTFGYDRAIPLCCGILRDGTDREPFWVKNVNCVGNENSLVNCPMDPQSEWGQLYPDCKARISEVGVLCYESTRTDYATYDYTIHLNSGADQRWGFPMIKYKHFNGHISADRGMWTDREASVICRQLNAGWVGGYSAPGRVWRHWNGSPQWMKNVTCAGHESNIASCQYAAGFGDNFWVEDDAEGLLGWYSHNKDVGVVCYEEGHDPLAAWSIKVLYGREYPGQISGLVIVHFSNLDGTICINGFNDSDARVVCREAGYSNGVATPQLARRNKMIWMSNLECNGTEPSVVNCTFEGWGGIDDCEQHDTDYGDAGVYCFNNDEYYEEYRINGGRSNYGYIEIDIAGYLGTVCHSYWSTVHALKVCNEFGFPIARRHTHGNAGKGIGPTHLMFQNVDWESPSLLDCPRYKGIGWTNCNHQHKYDAGLFCYDNQDHCANGITEVVGDEGIIKTTHEDHNYQPNRKCIWRIAVPEPYRVVLTFFTFKVDSSFNCRKDSVNIRDGFGRKRRIVPPLCGTTVPEPVRSTGNKMEVRFKSDHTRENRGFVAVYHKECPGIDMLIHTETVHNITGTTFKKIKTLPIDRCKIECDKDSYCTEIYYDLTNNDCYLRISSYHGRMHDLNGIEVLKFEKQCIVCHRQWTSEATGELLYNEYNKTIEEIATLDRCKLECGAVASCVSVSYSNTLQRCILNVATMNENGNATLLSDNSYVYAQTKCVGPLIAVDKRASTCLEYEMAARRSRKRLKSGWFSVTVNDIFTPVYCDFERDGGGWMLLVRSVSNDWDINKLYERSYPMTQGDYSILHMGDFFKNKTSSDWFRYRIEATGGYAGIWTSLQDSSLMATDTCQDTIRLNRQHGTWDKTEDLAQCLPYIKTSSDSTLLTASSDPAATLGVLIKQGSSVGFLSNHQQPEEITYWLREAPPRAKAKFHSCKNFGRGIYDKETDSYTCQCKANTEGDYCEIGTPAQGTFKRKSNMKLAATPLTLIHTANELSCVNQCALHSQCKSINFNADAIALEDNCELIGETAESALSATSRGWKTFNLGDSMNDEL